MKLTNLLNRTIKLINFKMKRRKGCIEWIIIFSSISIFSRVTSAEADNFKTAISSPNATDDHNVNTRNTSRIKAESHSVLSNSSAYSNNRVGLIDTIRYSDNSKHGAFENNTAENNGDNSTTGIQILNDSVIPSTRKPPKVTDKKLSGKRTTTTEMTTTQKRGDISLLLKTAIKADDKVKDKARKSNNSDNTTSTISAAKQTGFKMNSSRTDITGKTRYLRIGFLPSLSNQEKGHSKYIHGAFFYALNHVNKEVLKGTGVQLTYQLCDTKDNALVAMNCMTEMYYNDTVAFIGPEDSCRFEARLAAAWNRPIITYKCRESDVSNKNKMYPTFARTIPSTHKVSKSLIALMRYFGWTHFQAIVGNNKNSSKNTSKSNSQSNWLDTASTLRGRAEVAGITMMPDVYFEEPYIGDGEMHHIVEKTYRHTRSDGEKINICCIVYVFLGDDHALIDFARSLHNQKLNNGEYLTIAVSDEPYDPSNRYKYFKNSWDDFRQAMDMENLTQDHIDAFKSILMLLPSTPSNPKYADFLEESKNISYKAPFYAPKPPYANTNIKVPVYAAYLYDAVSLYARALKDIIKEGMDPRNGSNVIERIVKHNYESIQGNTMFIDANGSAEANYTMLALTLDSKHMNGFSQSMQPVAHFMTHGVSLPDFSLDHQIPWAGGKIPVSVPECGFDGVKCQMEIDWPMITVCLVAAIVGIIASVFMCRHYIYEQKLASLLWKIEYKDLMTADVDIEPAIADKPAVKLSRLSSLSGVYYPETHVRTSHAYMKVASYKGQLVAYKIMRRRHVEMTRAVKKELYMMKELSHDNLNGFVALVRLPSKSLQVWPSLMEGALMVSLRSQILRESGTYWVCECIVNSTIEDILENDNIHLDDMFIASLINDLLKGMIYLHDSPIVSHGNLRPSNCLVDSRWVLQITDFGLHNLKGRDGLNDDTQENLLWYAPELLRMDVYPPAGTQKGDVYAFAFILYEVHGRRGPWGRRQRRGQPTSETKKEENESAKYKNLSDSDIVAYVKQPPFQVPFRPDINDLNCKEFAARCIEECWQEDESQRPDFKYIRQMLKPMHQGLSTNIFDNMLAIMEKYANRLESLVSERTQQLAEEKKKTESLLLTMLPKVVAEQLIRNEPVIPEHYDMVTIYFSDIVGFTEISAKSSPMQVVDMLNDLYTKFDAVIEGYDAYKVETIGDAYMVVSGLPIRNGDNHAGEVASLALNLLRSIQDFRIRHLPTQKLYLRVGINSGPVVAGVVGLKMPRYCLFGDTVNTTSRMESTGEASKVHCSETCKKLLEKLGGYYLERRGMTTVKGKGRMMTYFVTGEDTSRRRARILRGEVKTRGIVPPLTRYYINPCHTYHSRYPALVFNSLSLPCLSEQNRLTKLPPPLTLLPTTTHEHDLKKSMWGSTETAFHAKLNRSDFLFRPGNVPAENVTKSVIGPRRANEVIELKRTKSDFSLNDLLDEAGVLGERAATRSIWTRLIRKQGSRGSFPFTSRSVSEALSLQTVDDIEIDVDSGDKVCYVATDDSSDDDDNDDAFSSDNGDERLLKPEECSNCDRHTVLHDNKACDKSESNPKHYIEFPKPQECLLASNCKVPSECCRDMPAKRALKSSRNSLHVFSIANRNHSNIPDSLRPLCCEGAEKSHSDSYSNGCLVGSSHDNLSKDRKTYLKVKRFYSPNLSKKVTHSINNNEIPPSKSLTTFDVGAVHSTGCRKFKSVPTVCAHNRLYQTHRDRLKNSAAINRCKDTADVATSSEDEQTCLNESKHLLNLQENNNVVCSPLHKNKNIPDLIIPCEDLCCRGVENINRGISA